MNGLMTLHYHGVTEVRSMASVDPGELRYQATLLVPVRSIDDNGHYVTADTEIPVRCAARLTRSGETDADGALRYCQVAQFIMRWREGVTMDASVRFNGVRYEIDSVDIAPWAGGFMRIRATSVDNVE